MKRIFVSLLLLMILGLWATQPVYAQGTEPIAENMELKTYRNASVGGKLNAYDPEGGELKYSLTTEPVKGKLELNEDGSFVYTPEEGKKGRDYFGYKVSDADGNISQEATVIIRIEKQNTDVLYSDMDGHPQEYSALLLSEMNVYTGKCAAGQYCFEPDDPVTRGEFISLCMSALGDGTTAAVLNTGYSDDAVIPVWMKSYATEARMTGVYKGESFEADEPICHDEAALILNRALGLNNISYMPVEPGVENETVQACINLNACGVFDEAGISPDTVTKADMAKYIAAAISLINNR